MSEEGYWNIGDIIVLRGVGKKGIWYALPVYVVQDTSRLIALFWPAGTQGKWRMKSQGAKVTPHDILQTPMEIMDRTWDKTDVLMLITPGAAHAIYLMWEVCQKTLIRWYVNLQDPVRRTLIGFDTKDHLLDIVFSPDKSNWQWKDENQLKAAVSLGIFTDAEALAIRTEGERVINLIRENRPPFCDGWEKWSPPTNWNVPKLRFDWNLGF